MTSLIDKVNNFITLTNKKKEENMVVMDLLHKPKFRVGQQRFFYFFIMNYTITFIPLFICSNIS